MNDHHQLLQIHIYNTDGSFETFVQNEEDLAKRILDEFLPDRIFARDKITIADGHSLTAFPVNQVVRLDLVSERLLGWMPPSEIVPAVELSETEFRALLRNPELGGQWDPLQTPDASVVVFLEVEMAGQPPLFLVMEIAGEPLADPPGTVASLFAAPALCFRMRSGGIAALNLAHLMAVTLLPGSQPLPLDAWPAQRVRSLQPNRPARNGDDQALPPGILQAAR